MNLSLMDPFVLAQDYPDALIGKLRSGHVTCLRFNRHGDYLAAGRADGTVIVFDVETNGIAHKLNGHTRQIQSLSWSRDARFLLSSSQDWKCILWDLKDGSKMNTVKFEAPVYMAELHPFNKSEIPRPVTPTPTKLPSSNWIIASLFDDQPNLVDISNLVPIKHPLSSAPRRHGLDRDLADGKQTTQDAKVATCSTIFSADGNHVFAGTNKGWLNVIAVDSKETVHSTRLCNGIITYLRLTTSGRDMLSNCSDRVIRTVSIPDLTCPTFDFETLKIEVEHKFQDVVNRLSWNDVAFSPTGEYVTASTYMNHDIYIWERSHGSLVKILEGPKEELGAVEWHPTRPLVCACGLESGRIYLWSIVTPQKWSALAPDFVEVEENVEYVEKEEEFDIHPAEELHKRRLDLEDEEIDALSLEVGKGFIDNRSFRMPVSLDIEDSDSEDDVVAIGPGQMRRRSPGEGKEWMGAAEPACEGHDERPMKQIVSAKPHSRTRRQ